MNISFDTEKFANDPKGLTTVLYSLRARGTYFDTHSPDIEKIVCKTPSSAYRYTKFIAKSGVSAEAEKVFLKNPKVAIEYLSWIRRPHLLDEKTQARLWKKIVKCPWHAYQWSSAFKIRLSEAEEEIFVHSLKCARDYAMFIIKGKFPEKVHNMLVLKSFDTSTQWEKGWLQEYIKYTEGK